MIYHWQLQRGNERILVNELVIFFSTHAPMRPPLDYIEDEIPRRDDGVHDYTYHIQLIIKEFFIVRSDVKHYAQ